MSKLKKIQQQKRKRPVFGGLKKEKGRITAQESIPYEYLSDDGIAYLGGKEYSATFRMMDINYSKITESGRIAIFERYCAFLNALTDDVRLQINILTKQISRNLERLVLPDPVDRKKEYQTCVGEYNTILDRWVHGENSYTQEKYITVTVQSPDYDEALRKIEHIGNDAMGILNSINCTTSMLDKIQRIMLLREIYRPEETREITKEQFATTGMSDKDMIAPYGMDTSDEIIFQLGENYTNILFLTDFPEEFPDDIIREITSINENLLLTINIVPQNPQKALHDVKQRLRLLDKEEADSFSRQMKASLAVPRTPRDLKKAIENMEAFQRDLQTRNEKMFLCNVLIMTRAKEKSDLLSIQNKVEERVLKTGCSVHKLKFDVENALNSVVPLGRNDTFIRRTFTTTSTAVFIPFNVVEILNPDGLLYGKNKQSNNLLLLDRKALDNPHGFISGTSGSGKSMGGKQCIWECANRTGDDILIIDPDGEFTKTVHLLDGKEINISNGTSIRFNPFDINENYGGEDEDDPIPFKSDFIISLLEVILGDKRGIDPVTRSVIDRCVLEVYKAWKQAPVEENIPTFRDFYEELKKQPEEEASYLVSALEIYIVGSLNIFAERTNVSLNSRIISFNTKKLGKQLKNMAMAIIQDFCWNHISKNQTAGKITWLWNDEVHTSLRHPNTAAWVIDSWKRGRKYGLIATGMTQEINDVMKSAEARSLLANSEFIVLYRQKESMIEDISQVMSLSEEQIHMLLQCEPGTGLLKAGNNIVEFDNRIPEGTKLFDTFMTDIKGEKRKDAAAHGG